MSVVLVFEVDVLLRSFKFARLISLIQAISFNLIYVAAAWHVITEVNEYANTPYGTADWLDVFFCMTVFYNLVLHVGIFMINNVIITKEFSLEYF